MTSDPHVSLRRFKSLGSIIATLTFACTSTLEKPWGFFQLSQQNHETDCAIGCTHCGDIIKQFLLSD